MKILLAVLLLLCCSSCVQLGGDPQPLRYYLLQPNATAQPVKLPAASGVVLTAVHLPAYLDRPQLTTHNDQQQAIIAPFARWAEPLEENFSRVLQENLTRHLPKTRISTTSRPDSSDNLIVNLTVISFDGMLDQQITVDIRWSISAEKTLAPLRQGRFSVATPIGTGYAELVRGLNSALNDFSYKLALELAEPN